MTAKLLITASSTLALVGAIGGVSYIYSKKEASNGSKVSKSKINPIFDLEAYKTELSSNETLKAFLKTIISGSEIQKSDWKTAIDSIKNEKIKTFLQKLIPDSEFDKVKTKIKELFNSKNTEILHNSITLFLNSLMQTNIELKNFLNEIIELLVEKPYSEIKNHALSKGLWFLVFPQDKNITPANHTCNLNGKMQPTTCNFYDANLNILNSNYAFTEIPKKYHADTLDDQLVGLVPIINKYKTANSDAWSAMTSLVANKNTTAEKAIEWYKNGHKFIKDNWKQIIAGIKLPESGISTWTFNNAISEIEENIKKLDNFTTLPNDKLTTALLKNKAYLIHFPDKTIADGENKNYADMTKDFYSKLTGINMERKNSHHYIQTAEIGYSDKKIPAIPINAALIKAIKNDIERIKEGHFSWLLTLGALWYVEGLKLSPHTNINKIQLTTTGS